jgi:hypothetical protein
MYTSSLSYTVRKKLTKISTRLATCGIYYAFWIFILPHFGKYRIRQEVLLLSDETSKAHRLRGSGAQSDEDGNQTPEKKDV